MIDPREGFDALSGLLGDAAWGFMAGLVVGTLYLALLWAGVRALARPRPGPLFALLAAARLALLLGALAVAAALGTEAAGFLAALGGFLAARTVATRLARGGARRPAWR